MALNQSYKSVNLPFSRILRLLLVRRELHKRDNWTREKLLRHQVKTLDTLRAHAYKSSSFYRRFHSKSFEKPLHELPVLTKRELMENWNDVVTDQTLKIDNIRKFVEELEKPLLFRGKYVISTTSGSTGLTDIANS